MHRRIILLSEWLRTRAIMVLPHVDAYKPWIALRDIVADHLPHLSKGAQDRIAIELGWIQVEQYKGEKARQEQEREYEFRERAEALKTNSPMASVYFLARRDQDEHRRAAQE